MTKTQKKELSDYNIVQQQFLMLRNLEYDIDNINIINNYHEKEHEIGETTEHIKYNSYKYVFDNLLSEDKYTILLTDDSMFVMQYIFNENGSIKEHTLSFLPNYKVDILGRKDDENINDADISDANISDETFCRRLSNYVRIDYSEVGRQEYYHSLVHLHLGVFEEGIRLPLQHFLYPYEFLFLIFKYIYKKDDKELRKLEFMKLKESKLTENEMKKFKVVFGNV